MNVPAFFPSGTREDEIPDDALIRICDIVPLIAQTVRSRDEEINALRRLVADQATRIATLADLVARYEADAPTTH